ncbi:MAG: S8 family peptidase [Candidatus Aminicenantaceae bacterium]
MKRKKRFLTLISVSLFIFLSTFIQSGSIISAKGDIYQNDRSHSTIPRIHSQGPNNIDKLLVKFKPRMDEHKRNLIAKAFNTKIIGENASLDIYVLQILENEDIDMTLYLLKRNPDIIYAEKNYPVYITETPNDIFFKLQYSLHTSNTIPGSSQLENRPDIRATEGWEETKGDEEVIIAIVDTGVDLLHPDLENKIISNGRDFINDDFDANDDHGHGTHVAGIAAADTDNSNGIAGVAWNCKILPIKSLNKNGVGEYSHLINGITYAANNGAHVINLSVGGENPSQALSDALSYAYDKDIVIVASTGNEGGAVLYPAAYDDYCLAVAATDENNQRVSWSNFGPEVDVAAPGKDIFSCDPTALTDPGRIPYQYRSGTSMATPHVAGLAALIKSLKPWLTADEIMNIIRYSSDDINQSDFIGNDQFIGYGRINMEKALVPIIISKIFQNINFLKLMTI